MTSLRARLEASMFRAAMGLPPAAVRWLAGREVMADGHVLDPEVQWMLRIQRIAREPDVATLPLADGRRALRRHARLAGGDQPIGASRDLRVPGPAGPMAARLYVPRAAETSWLLVYLHGGGLVYGDLDGWDPACRVLAERAGVRVLSLDYRLGPEHRHPAALEDATAGLAWAVEHAAELGADPARVCVGGDSAGGYLAAAVAIRAAQRGIPCARQLLVYPATNLADRSESRRRFADGSYYLSQTFIDRAEQSYFGDADRRDPEVSVHYVDPVPPGLAPALVVTAGFDPLRDEGDAYARRLLEAGVEVELLRFSGQVHGFVNVVGVGRTSRANVEEVADALRAALLLRQ